MLLYALTVLLGAFLLFEVQPLIGKAILPWFGGAPAVWTTCMLFFQLLLLGGYLYAHVLIARLSPRRARSVHVALLAAALLALFAVALYSGWPLLPPPEWKPEGAARPAARILLLLTATVGLPYLVLSTTGPLLQAWAARTHPGARVYRLYALSNAGSLVALVSYPLLVERLLPLKVQAAVWSAAFAGFALGSGVCAWRMARGSAVAFEPATLPAAATLHESARGASVSSFLFWFLLAACGSTALLATTNQMCQEVAAIPFLWVLPLCLYLLSFVLCFESDRIYRRGVFGPLLAIGLGWAGLVLFRGFSVPIRTQVEAYSLALFGACMVCHGELARTRPPHERLTSFYLAIASGGAAGGVFVAVVAPLLFRGFWEVHIALFASGLVAFAALARDRSSWLYSGRAWPAFLLLVGAAALAWRVRDPQFFSSLGSRLKDALGSGGGRVALVAAAAALVVLIARGGLWIRGQAWLAGTCLAGALVLFGFVLYSELREFRQSVSISRNFYGVLTVERLDAGNPASDRLSLRHGRIVHGFEYLAPDKRDELTTYYAQSSGIGLALLHHPRRAAGGLAVGAIGLGVGTLASYGKPGDSYCFYEINPQVARLAAGPASVFRFVRDSPSRVEVHMGDARLSLERELASGHPRRFDVLAVDAFSSDSIPVHLLTREALRVYLAHLAPGGILALHLSNRHLNLVPVAGALARSLDLEAALVDRSAEGEAIWGSTWVLLAREPEPFEVPALDDASEDLPESPRVRVWTDDYSNLFDVLK